MGDPYHHIDFFKVDKYNLDRECERLPKQYFICAREQADAERSLAQRKAERDVVAAEIEKEVRENPERYNLDKKLSEGVLERICHLDPRWQKANQEVIDAAHHVKIAEAATWALSHKKGMIEGEISLFLANYYSKPRTSTTPNYLQREREHDDET